MSRTSQRRAPAAILVALAALVACDREPKRLPADTAVAPPPPVVTADSTPAAPRTAWNSDAGAALLVRGEQGEAWLIVPGVSDGGVTDTVPGPAAAALPGDAALFTTVGATGRARAEASDPARADDAPDDCTAWPAARLTPPAGATLPAWTVGFVGGQATALALDSLPALASADSAALAVALSRAAAALPGDTARRLRGLPFAVRWARRFTPEPGVDAVIAALTRTLGQEASPLGEYVLLVAERRAKTGDQFAAAYHERAVGSEETLESAEALAAVRVGPDGQPVIVIARDYYEGSAYSLLEREGFRRWRLRWTSAYRGC